MSEPTPPPSNLPSGPLQPAAPGLKKPATPGLQPTETGDSFWTWVKSLWPAPYERQIAKRYVLRYRGNTLLKVLSVLFVLLTASVEVGFFLVPAMKGPTMALVALITPLITGVLLLLNFFSVFSTMAAVGVVLGVAALTVVMSVTSGFQTEIRNRVIGLNAHVLILKYGTDFQEYESTLTTLRSQPQVLAGSPFVYNEMLIAKEGSRSAGVLVKGIDPVRSRQVLDFQRWLLPDASGARPELSALQNDRTPAEGGPPLPAMFLGLELAKRMKLKVGDRARLIAPLLGLDGISPDVQPENADGPIPPPPPRASEFYVAGIFSAGFDEYDRRLVVVSLPRAQELVGQGNVVTGIELRVKDVLKSRFLGGEFVKALGGPPYRSLDWEELNHNLFTALALQKAVLTLVLFLIILIAAFNIVASLTMMVIDKVHEVAILKAMGMSVPSVATIFRTAGLAIGLTGTVLGTGMGLLTCALIERLGYLLDAKVYMIAKLPTQVSLDELALTVLVTLLICFLATLYPSFRAADLHPVDGLRMD